MFYIYIFMNFFKYLILILQNNRVRDFLVNNFQIVINSILDLFLVHVELYLNFQ